MTLNLKDFVLNKDKFLNKEIRIQGWVRNQRKQKSIGFINLIDGSMLDHIQVVYKKDLENFEKVNNLGLYSSLIIEGVFKKNNDKLEIYATNIKIINASDPNYPIQPKKHSREFLRENAHLRTRTKLFYSIFKLRSFLAYKIHEYFQGNNFTYVNTPILTSIDAEGAGEMFSICPINKKDFFGKKANLTVTGQLHVETFAMSFKKVYTFGPTFRAENSNTTRHMSEFWMIEPEIAFADINTIIKYSKGLLKFISKAILNSCSEEIDFLNSLNENVDLVKRLKFLSLENIEKITYTEVIDILKENAEKFNDKIFWGMDLSSEHEKFLTDVYFKNPIIVINYPTKIKAFYMLLNDEDNGKTVSAMDLLVPQIGELIGGSAREYRQNKLIKKIEEFNISKEELNWYIDINKYGGVPHAGFGIGFERLLMYISGIENIRDVIPFPRTANQLSF